VVAKRLDPQERFGLRVTLLAVAVVLVGAPFGLLLDQIEDRGRLVRIDTYAANHLHGWVLRHIWFKDVCEVLSFLAVPPVVLVLMALAALYWLRAGHPRLGLYLLLTGWAGVAIDTVVKLLVNRDRPSLVDPIATAGGKSFPSGHTMAATYGFGALLLAFMPLIDRRWRTTAVAGWLLLVVLVAVSRLGLGVHYITDVIGGFVLGLAWLAASTAAFSIWRAERGRPGVAPLEGLEPDAGRD
jgi:undecaprenyl-diphosphatase